ncbi:hypothetical protein LJR084_001880 [Variovorax sp. LjRoot84]|uniref:hypothetical protein n=1 Tax=Variovorax sp. LjRoot84 TaxID=3342340 RepID=UPI003ED13F8C
MSNYERWQQLLLKIRDLRCAGNATELARRIRKDASYVHRLFWEEGRKGAKGIGPEIQQVCNEAFALPRGFWDMQPEEAFADEIAAQAKTSSSASASLTTAPAPAARRANVNEAMRVLFDALGTLEGFALSQAQNAVRYALDNPLEWQAAATTVERLLAPSAPASTSGQTAAARLRNQFPKRDAHSPLPAADGTDEAKKGS